MRLAVSDLVSPSYFVATAAVELGFFKAEGLDIELVPTPADPPTAFRNGEIDFMGTSPYNGLMAFPEWKGAKLLCALSRYAYWCLAIRADLGARRGDVSAPSRGSASAHRGGRRCSSNGCSKLRASTSIAITSSSWTRRGLPVAGQRWEPVPSSRALPTGSGETRCASSMRFDAGLPRCCWTSAEGMALPLHVTIRFRCWSLPTG